VDDVSINGTDENKIILAGLPNSGMRTIKAVVIDNNPPRELKPLLEKLDIGNSMKDLLQRRVLTIRCGGERSLQDITAKENDPIYQNVETLVFILDSSEQSNFSIAKYWFEALVNHLHKFSPEARIVLLLHKIDLITEKKNAAEYIRATKELFASNGLDLSIYETNIFDASVFMAFRSVLVKELDDEISVNQYLTKSLKGSSFTGLAVYSNDGLPIYEIGSLPGYVSIAANIILGANERIVEELTDDEVDSTIIQLKNGSFMVFNPINKNGVFVGQTIQRPKLGQMLIETEQIVDTLKKAMP
jgi:predicted regulator of Ras-like GTPase activity (Roadblock/LC7/MglB family)/GTPase SAR1 family protein